ncbi:MAG: ribosomal large subunit pseudouridine synthase B [Deltaproteobacteria bacterium]|nr:ribosomal large subunit pseudouridine synthase B [Deltaproteobacteria bacterium]
MKGIQKEQGKKQMLERIQKIMAQGGIASRREAERLILDGRVTLNGKVVVELGTKADTDNDYIKVNGKLITRPEPKTYVILFKPRGYVTTSKDPEGRPTVMELLEKVKVRVFHVGRLDYDTEGLILCTNDGDLAHRLQHPSHEIPKTYLVKVDGVPTQEGVLKLRNGVKLRDGMTAPARVKIIKKAEANSWLEIIIHEGRNRQIKRMFEAIGHTVIKLKREGLAFLTLGDLKPSEFRHLTAEEVKNLKAI